MRILQRSAVFSTRSRCFAIVAAARERTHSASRPSQRISQHRLFLWCCRAVFSLDDFQRADSGEIGFGLLLQTALAYAVGGGYAEITGRGWCGSSVAGSNDK